MPTLPLACGPDFGWIWTMLWAMACGFVLPSAHAAALVVAGPFVPVAPPPLVVLLARPPDPAVFDTATWRPLWPSTGHGQPPGGAAEPAREGIGARGVVILSLLGAAPALTAVACLSVGRKGRPRRKGQRPTGDAPRRSIPGA